MYEYVLIVDGGARNNGTPDSYGYGSCLIQDPASERSQRLQFTFGSPATNNEAEYWSLISTLRHILDVFKAVSANLKEVSLTIKMDSALVIGQLSLGWKVKADNLRPLFTEASNLLTEFGSYEFVKIPEKEMKNILGH